MLSEQPCIGAGSHACVNAQMQVRPGQCQDVCWMLPLWTTMMEGHARHDEAFALADDAPRIWQQSMWDLMARQDSFVLVAPNIGFCCGWVSRHPAIYAAREVGLLSEICVADNARRIGVGSALVRAAHAWFAGRDVQEFQLTTALFNKRAQNFFEALGGRAILKRYHFAVTDAQA